MLIFDPKFPNGHWHPIQQIAEYFSKFELIFKSIQIPIEYLAEHRGTSAEQGGTLKYGALCLPYWSSFFDCSQFLSEILSPNAHSESSK